MKNILKLMIPCVAVALTLTSCNDTMDDKWDIDSRYALASSSTVSLSSVTAVDYQTITATGVVANPQEAVEAGIQIAGSSDFSADIISVAADETAANFEVSYAKLAGSTTYYVRAYVVTKTAGTLVTEPQSVTTPEEPVSEWVKMSGKATYRDDMIGSLWNIGNDIWQVDIYESQITPGRYKVIAPYSPKTGFRYSALWDDDEEIDTFYKPSGENEDMIIDATDPDFVYFEYFETGYVDLAADGMLGMTSYVHYWLTGGNDLETVKSARPGYFGKLKDGVITFPEQTLLLTIDGEPKWYGNSSGLFALALPGATIADYSAEVAYAGVFISAAGETSVVGELTLGADAVDVKAVVVSADADASAVADAIAAGDIEATDVQDGTIYVPLEDGLTGNLQLVVVVLNDGDVKTVTSSSFEYYGGGAGNPWKAIGTGLLTDNLFITMYSPDGTNTFDPETFEVEIQENKDEPGLYRMVNPFEYYSNYFDYTSANIDVNATDANGVYILPQATGIDDGDGMTYIASYGGYQLGSYSFDQLKEAGYFGWLKDGVITLPKFPASDGSFEYQGLFLQGKSGWYSGTEGDFKLVLPEAVTARARAKAKAHTQALQFAKRMNLRPFVPGKAKASKQLKKGQRVTGRQMNLR